jgi:hypothetical protein
MPKSSFKRRRIAPDEWSNWKRRLSRRRSPTINCVTKVRILSVCTLSSPQLAVTDTPWSRDPAVTLNEHLMEALRRLRRNAADTSVDRRLITNVLLQFITTPRADAKRFEMLGLLASILQWSDQERERAGLQRSVTAGGARGKGRVVEEKIEESEVGHYLSPRFPPGRAKLTAAIVLLPNVGRIPPQRGLTRQRPTFGRSTFPGWYSPTTALPSLPSASSASSTGGGTPTESRFKLPSLALGRAGMIAMSCGFTKCCEQYDSHEEGKLQFPRRVVVLPCLVIMPLADTGLNVLLLALFCMTSSLMFCVFKLPAFCLLLVSFVLF